MRGCGTRTAGNAAPEITGSKQGWSNGRWLGAFSPGVPHVTGRDVARSGNVVNGVPQFVRVDPLVLPRNSFTDDGNSIDHAGILHLVEVGWEANSRWA